MALGLKVTSVVRKEKTAGFEKLGRKQTKGGSLGRCDVWVLLSHVLVMPVQAQGGTGPASQPPLCWDSCGETAQTPEQTQVFPSSRTLPAHSPQNTAITFALLLREGVTTKKGAGSGAAHLN